MFFIYSWHVPCDRCGAGVVNIYNVCSLFTVDTFPVIAVVLGVVIIYNVCSLFTVDTFHVIAVVLGSSIFIMCVLYLQLTCSLWSLWWWGSSLFIMCVLYLQLTRSPWSLWCWESLSAPSSSSWPWSWSVCWLADHASDIVITPKPTDLRPTPRIDLCICPDSWVCLGCRAAKSPTITVRWWPETGDKKELPYVYPSSTWLLPWLFIIKALNYLYKLRWPRCFIQFDNIISVLFTSFWFIWIPMSWVYGHYYYQSNSVGIHFRRQNLTSTDVRFWRLKWINRAVRYLPLYRIVDTSY